MSVIAQTTLGSDLHAVQAGPNLPSRSTGFICCTCTWWRRGPAVL